MRIKERDNEKFFSKSKKILMLILKKIYNRKMGIILIFLMLLLTLFFGLMVGLIISGFFGTYDNPSATGRYVLHKLGFEDLRTNKQKIDSILAENIKIPLNLLIGQFSSPEKIYLDIKFGDYKKLEYKRQEALGIGVLISSPGDSVPAKITYNNKVYDSDIRLKGKWLDHIEGDKWSLKIDLKGENTISGMRRFSIQAPERRNYLNEFVYLSALKKEDVLSPRYKVVEVFINGEKKGIYTLEENFRKELVESSQRIDSVIIEFSDENFWEKVKGGELTITELSNDDEWFLTSKINVFDSEAILNDSTKIKQFEEAKGLLESFREEELKTHEVFDVDKLARYAAITTITEAHHAFAWGSIKFYYNPITSLLEPIGFDAEIGATTYQGISQYSPKCLNVQGANCQVQKGYYELFFSDPIFFKKYMQELERVSEESYLDELFGEIDEDLKRYTRYIHKDAPSYHFFKEEFYTYQKRIKNELNNTNIINAYFKGTKSSEDGILLSLGNINILPMEIENVVLNDTIILNPKNQTVLQRKIPLENVIYQEVEFELPVNIVWKDEFSSELKINYKAFGTNNLISQGVLPWSNKDGNFFESSFIREEPNAEKFEFVEINSNTKEILLKKGSWILNKSLIIPPNFKVIAGNPLSIDLTNEATILSYSELDFSGTSEDPIIIKSSDGQGQGLTVMSAGKSSLRNVNFENLASPSKGNWELTGAVTFYESPLIAEGVSFSNARAEDSLNIVRGKFEIIDSNFENSDFDCLDVDFGNGIIKSSTFTNCGNDGLDVSGTIATLENIKIFEPGDKGISGGEESIIEANGIQITGCYIGVAGKDNSNIKINEIEISNCEYGFAVYQKKPEFGPSSIDASQSILKENKNDYIVEKKSSFTINNRIILGSENKVYETLYPGQ